MTSGDELDAPTVILVAPQLGDNIGSAARAMLNFGLTDLRLVQPRDGWPSKSAVAYAAGATQVLDDATLHADSAEAIADLQWVYATTARPRDMDKPVITPHQAAAEMRAATARGEKVGILFGRERSGLGNDDVTLANKIISVPLNADFPSMNLAQAVMLVSYEWYQSGLAEMPVGDNDVGDKEMSAAPPPTGSQMQALFKHLEDELVESRFLYPPAKVPSMVRNLRNLIMRGNLSAHDVRILRGVIASLTRKKENRSAP